MIVGGAIDEHAVQSPRSPAIAFGSETITWRELDDLLRKAAAWIMSRSPQGAKLALHLPHSPALAVLFLAGARLGCDVQIFDTQWPQAVCDKVLQELKPALAISCNSQLACENLAWISREQLSFDAFARLLDVPISHWPDVDPDAIFYTGFTSGTSGLPKAYRRTHRSWIMSFDAAALEFPLVTVDIVLAPGTLTHSLFLFALAYAMQAGAQCVMCGTFRPDHVIAAAHRHRASVLFAVPAQLGLLARFAANGLEPAINLRRIISSGSKWNGAERSALRVAFPAAHLSEFYGTSETSFITVAHESDGVPEDSVGRAFAGVFISVCDDKGQPLPTGKKGRIFVRSNMLFSGYALADGQIERLPDGSICTGDIGYLDSRGQLFFAGRENRKIVTSGKNLYPEEVERVLESHVAIRAAAVIAAADGKRGEKPVAIVNLHRDIEVSRAQIVAYARTLLPLYKVPGAFLRAHDWPTTRSGKTDFRALQEMMRRNELEHLP